MKSTNIILFGIALILIAIAAGIYMPALFLTFIKKPDLLEAIYQYSVPVFLGAGFILCLVGLAKRDT